MLKDCKEIFLYKRFHRITKPFIAVLILIGKCPKVKPTVNYMLKKDIEEIWYKSRGITKTKDFLDQLKSFDIRKVNYSMTAQIAHLFQNDPYMTEWWIARESTQALNLFRWVNKILEYIGVALKLKELGM